MRYIISIFILSPFLGCSSSPKQPQGKAPTLHHASSKGKAGKLAIMGPLMIESTKKAAKYEDFCYHQKNKGNKRCRYTLLSKEAQETRTLNDKKLAELANKHCRDGQLIKMPRIEKQYSAARSREDAVGRVANLAIKKGANTIFMQEIKPRFVSGYVYDCSQEQINKITNLFYKERKK